MTNLSEEKHKPLNSPFKWVGGKSRLRKYVIELLPEHTCYLELFSGAAWTLFGKPLSDVEIINDIDQDLVTFFRVLREKPEELIASFEWELVSRAEFERLAELDTSQLTDVQRAHRFYYLIMAGWGGELNYPRFQTSVTDGGHGNRLIGALKTLRQRLQPVHERLRTVIIENLDWQPCLERYDRLGTVMYVDPPYPGNKCNYAHNMRGWDEHHLLAERLKNAKCKWIRLLLRHPRNAHPFFQSLHFRRTVRVGNERGKEWRRPSFEQGSLDYELWPAEVAAPKAERSRVRTADARIGSNCLVQSFRLR